ncbi:phosphatase [uncultured Parolsenella sp.]|uniref:Ppx/GppA phosphatase family protein n=1 Tax=uncultured Parolsenella sp. TaxID=2083008 RepID=UPI0027D93DB7|nr:phosphatase [uncultured Parolsenella sp.]
MGRVAVIDIGTVTCRLGVADVAGGRVERCAKTSTICNLGEGVAQTGRLSEAACERVVTCVDKALANARAASAPAACCTLTSAARDASNSSVLLDALRARGVVPQVIPGEVEGSLTFLGVAQDFRGERIMVADNGGGSTEIAVGTLADTIGPAGAVAGPGSLELEAVRSLNVGCRRVTDLFLSREGSPALASLADARAFCRDVFARELPDAARGPKAPGRLVCVGGTVTTLVAIDAKLDPYDPSYVHLHDLTLDEVDALASRLAALPLEKRREVVGLQPKRAGVIVAGAVCVGELMRACGVERLTVSESDLLFGLSLVTDAVAGGKTSPVGWRPELFALR